MKLKTKLGLLAKVTETRQLDLKPGRDTSLVPVLAGDHGRGGQRKHNHSGPTSSESYRGEYQVVATAAEVIADKVVVKGFNSEEILPW